MYSLPTAWAKGGATGLRALHPPIVGYHGAEPVSIFLLPNAAKDLKTHAGAEPWPFPTR